MNMTYPHGRCANCESEFSADLRKVYHITHCPWCGVEIDDFMSFTDSTEAEERKNDIFCEDCGRRIYERDGKGGHWIDKNAGVCSGQCESELCGLCADWKEGECWKCREGKCK